MQPHMRGSTFETGPLSQVKGIFAKETTERLKTDNAEVVKPSILNAWTDAQQLQMGQWGLMSTGSRLTVGNADYLMRRFRVRHFLAMALLARSDEFSKAIKLCLMFRHPLVGKSGFDGSREVSRSHDQSARTKTKQHTS